TFFSKRGEDVGRWGEFMEFDGTKLKLFPIPKNISVRITSLAAELDILAGKLAKYSPDKTIYSVADNLTSALQIAKVEESEVWQEMIFVQEELDWHVYYQYGLTDSLISYQEKPVRINLGERAFEILMARNIKDDIPSWFLSHGSTPITDIPTHWPPEYRRLI